MRKAKQKSWQTFTSSATDAAKASRLNRILSKKQFHNVGLLKLPDGTLTENIHQSYRVLMDEHFPGCEKLPSNHAQRTGTVSSQAETTRPHSI